ncbi:MAG TPA: DUF4349 domain-containing protein [Casimicrobiaceae bacterium]|nr:DUF4349 domain-containing protein [Casimicrobiaceae bacterium]
MSQRDLVAELRAARVRAPREVRDRVHLIAEEHPDRERRSFPWRRALVLAVPVAAAIAAAVVIARPQHHAAATPTVPAIAGTTHGAAFGAPTTRLRAQKALAVPAAPKRIQQVGASISLHVASISDGVRRAVAIATSLSGYAASVHASTHGKTGTADLTLKVPRSHAQTAIDRLSKLGTVTSEQVDITDRQEGLNATDREIARLQKQLAKLRSQHAPAKQIAAVTARIQALQRSESSTRRTAHFATIGVHLATPAPPAKSKSHAWRDVAWAVLGAAALALLLLAFRVVRRWREYALLSRL